MHILIVDDNRLMRQLIRDILRPVSDDVVECDDGSAALATYLAHRPDWVLMDVEMAGLDGLGATRAILAECPGARIIIVTQYADATTRAAAAAAGAIGFVSKDDLTELRAKLVEAPGRPARTTTRQ